MAKNMAAQRALKANRRKAIVAEKRKADAVAGSLAARVRRAAALPIRQCLVSETLFRGGIGQVILTRGVSSLSFELASFLVDVHCLGVKDVVFRTIESEEYEDYVAALESATALVAVAPADARKLLRDAAAWAGQFGFPPHKDYAVVERAFGDASAEASEAVFEFGRDGKPFYVSGPFDTPAQIRRRTEMLYKRFGNEAQWMIELPQLDAFEFEDEEEEGEGEGTLIEGTVEHKLLEPPLSHE